jgi:hypothetical protein
LAQHKPRERIIQRYPLTYAVWSNAAISDQHGGKLTSVSAPNVTPAI